jgi:hypothetical protein
VPEGQVALPRTTQLSGRLVEFAKKYAVEPVANLRPRAGFVTLAGEQIPWAIFQKTLNEATEAGVIR